MAKATTADTQPAKAGKAKSGKPSKNGKPNVLARLTQYLRDVRSEMRRVVWPQRPEIINSSLVVLVTLVFFILVTFAVDSTVVEILRYVTKLG